MSTIRRIAIALGSAAGLVLATPVVAHAQTATTDSAGINWGVFLLFGVVFGLVCAFIANSKGRSPVLWGILGFLFGLIPLIIIAVMKRKPPQYVGGYGGPPSMPPPPPV
jgi:peptidoglycan/LPS O-acetylase OafA/YrhL